MNSERKTRGFSCSHGGHRSHEWNNHDCCECCLRYIKVKEVTERRITQSADGGTYVQVQYCDVAVDDDLQRQLRESCTKGDTDVTERLIKVGANPNYCNSDGTIRPPVYYASRNGHTHLLKLLVEKYRCNVLYRSPRGTTLLHIACLHGYEDMVIYLAKNHHLDPSARTKHGSTPLHLACIGGWAQIVQFLIENLGCDPKCTGELDETPLHTACTKGHLAIMKYLIRVHYCNPNQPTRVASGGETTLHLACQQGHLDIVRYLILEQHCDPNVKDFFQNTPLHSAAQQNKANVVAYLVQEQKCSLEPCNRDNYTPLHLASKYSRLDVVRVLLENGANPSIPGRANQTPIQLATDHEVIKLLIQHGARPQETQVKVVFPRVSLEHNPQDTIIRAMVVGDPATGKSTLVEALKHSNSGRWPFTRTTIQVEPYTAGIVPHEFVNSDFGHTILFDFAGQSEYYTSHAMVIDCTNIAPAPIFMVVVDLSKDLEKIQLRLQFWISFIENNKPASVSVPHIIIIGSHYDIFHRQDQKSRQGTLAKIKSFAEDKIRRTSLQYRGFFPLNCQRISTQEDLRKAMQKSCQSLRMHVPDDTLGHALSVYLFALFKGVIMCTLKELADTIKKNDWSFPYSTDKLVELCERLGSKVNIMFIKNKANLEQSTIILDVDTLLRRINGIIFAPNDSHFPQHHLESRNGIVPFSKLRNVFSDIDPRVVAECMQRLEFCHAIHDQGTLNLIKGESSRSSSSDVVEKDGGKNEEYFFFPSLVNVQTPTQIWSEYPNSHSYYTGWCLRCTDRDQGFSARLMHTILIRTAFTFAVDCNDLSESECHRCLKRACNVWSKGIHWFNLQGIENYLELREDGQVIVLVMRCFEGYEIKCVKSRSTIIQKTLETVKEFSPNLKIEEGLLDPRSLTKYPLSSINNFDVPFYSIDMVLKPLLGGNTSTFDKSKRNMIKLKELLFWDPYMKSGNGQQYNNLNDGKLHKILNDPDQQDVIISEAFLFDLSQWFSKDWQLLAFLFQIEPVIINNIEEANNKSDMMICLCILQHYMRQSSNPTYRDIRTLLEEYSLMKGRSL